MFSGRALWLDCCCVPQRQGLFRVAERRIDAHYANWRGEALLSAHKYRPSFFCVEYDYPDRTRLRAIPLLRREFPALPVLMLTEYHSEALAVWAFRHRVWDYRVKPITEDTLTRLFAVLTDTASPMPPQGWPRDNLPPDLIAPSGHLRKPLVAAPRTAPATAFVSEHYGEPVRLATVARLCHLSESEFSRSFHHEHGVSFRCFLLNYRIAMARDFLAEPRMSISQIAYAVGFNDLSQFGRMFRRIVGEPATRYQRRLHSPAQAAGRGRPDESAESFHSKAARS